MQKTQLDLLLGAIEQAGSITGAGKLLGLSYRGAWDSVQRLNALYGIPLIEASMGGSGGGGQASLTSAGKKLLGGLNDLRAELARAADRLAASLLESDGPLSKSWCWRGYIEAVEGPELTLHTALGAEIIALSACQNVERGMKANIHIPSPAVLLSRASILDTSARNQWHVDIVDREDCTGEASLTLKLRSGDLLNASVTRNSADRLGFYPARAAFALVKASQVAVEIIG